MGVNIETVVISDAMNCKSLHISTMKKKHIALHHGGGGERGRGMLPKNSFVFTPYHIHNENNLNMIFDYR